jgi:hypothetical protein
MAAKPVAQLFKETELPDGFKAAVAVICPFCAQLGRDCIYVAGEMMDGSPAICHSQPTCCEFERREPDDFMEAARLRMNS